MIIAMIWATVAMLVILVVLTIAWIVSLSIGGE